MDSAILISERIAGFGQNRRWGGMLASRRPVLRAPPFPGSKPVGRPALRKPGQLTASYSHTIDINEISAQIAKARVGGDFWQPSPSRPTNPRPSVAMERPSLTFDPWPMIEESQPIIAASGTEMALLAAAAGCAVLRPGDRRPYPRDNLLGNLLHRLVAFDYFDPWNGQPISIAAWIDILAEWRRTIDRNREIAVVCGIAAWKRSALATHLWSGKAPTFTKTPPEGPSPPGKNVAVWPSRVSPADRDRVRADDGLIVQIEDGFIRSAGLGSRLVPPCSIVVDWSGIYYDPRETSDLETLLSSAELGADLCRRAANLIQFLSRHGITKYGSERGTLLSLSDRRRKVLVAGQVADDRSVRLGRADVTNSLDLLRRVREIETDAYIIFKPHPDVVAGLRPGHVPVSEAARYVDLVLPDASIDDLLNNVDAVHVLTSLTGFEALLRGREVITHGQPFYAGWGLTRDLAEPIARRNRVLTLEQLVAATLILYPRYFDPVTGLPCPPEVLSQRFSVGSMPKPGFLQVFRSIQGRLNLVRRKQAMLQ
ncbi:hypothetical protein U0025_04770 [Sphingobium yanoikuyae]|nr:hypothetical protein [Sphingobium yanoikuyae]WQE08206.1 hypothetical protein U0025_04770 [Sphingobium yanoikuyae]